MKKKIIIGLVITVVISLTAFGAIYAYQGEKPGSERSNVIGDGINYSANGHRAGDCFGSTNEDGEWECPENEEQMRNNLRNRDEECEYYGQNDAARQEHRHMHENEYNEECEKNERSFQNQNKNSNNQNRAGNS